ncbi:MAG TPA: ribosome maturation factor RimM [Methylocella sp.]|nr:ribosome maturation factor RimM [Methylocella sp.]
MGKAGILVGRFGAPRGVAGELRLQSFTRDPVAIASYKPLLDETGAREFSIVRLRPLKGNIFVAKVAGVEDRAGAAALANAGLYVPRESLPEAGEEEFYYADLIGLSVFYEDGQDFGRVENVLNFGGGDILEIAPAEGGESVLLPFTKEVFPKVDIKDRRLTAVLPPETGALPPVRKR